MHDFFQGDLKDPVFREKKVKSVSFLLKFIILVIMVVVLKSTFDQDFLNTVKLPHLLSV